MGAGHASGIPCALPFGGRDISNNPDVDRVAGMRSIAGLMD